MDCKNFTLECIRNEYVNGKLFTGLLVNEQNGAYSAKVYIESPYTAEYSNGGMVITSGGNTYTLRLTQTKYDAKELRDIVSNCSCCSQGQSVTPLPPSVISYPLPLSFTIQTGEAYTTNASVVGLVLGKAVSIDWTGFSFPFGVIINYFIMSDNVLYLYIENNSGQQISFNQIINVLN